MQLRPALISDVDAIEEIDGTIETTQRLEIASTGEWPTIAWNMQMRPLSRRMILPNRLDDETRFMFRQIVSGAEEGVALTADYGGNLMAMAAARFDLAAGLLRVIDIRVDYEFRRQGLASALIFQITQAARDREMRAVQCNCKTDNEPAIAFARKLGFELCGVDMQIDANSDKPPRPIWLAWYLTL